VVTASSADPERPVSEGGLLPELFQRLFAGLVEIPPLVERPGDVPALLCAIAGREIVVDEHVLRCLIADRHAKNVRGLFAIIARANEESLAKEKGPLEIHLRHLGVSDELRQQFERATQPSRDPLRVFSFAPPVAPVVPAYLWAPWTWGPVRRRTRRTRG
jgi:DNA-binding NtrC family response regulator